MEITLHHVWIDGQHFATLIDAHRYLDGKVRSYCDFLPIGTVEFPVFADPFGDRHIATITTEVYLDWPCCDDCGPQLPHGTSSIKNRAA